MSDTACGFHTGISLCSLQQGAPAGVWVLHLRRMSESVGVLPCRFWIKRRRLVAVELRPTPPAALLPQFLLPPATIAAAASKRWPPGGSSPPRQADRMISSPCRRCGKRTRFAGGMSSCTASLGAAIGM